MITTPHITIIDDEPNVRLVFQTTLESSGFVTATASNGEAGLALLSSNPTDLVLLDLRMPVMDGMETLRRLREAGNDVPVVVITAHGAVPDAVEAMRLGAIDFVSKPISPESLREVVTGVLQRHNLTALDRLSIARTDPLSQAEALSTCLDRAKRAMNVRRFEEAETFLRMAIGLDDDSANVHNLLGVLSELRGQRDQAFREYRHALNIDSEHEAANQNMNRFYARVVEGSSGKPLRMS